MGPRWVLDGSTGCKPPSCSPYEERPSVIRHSLRLLVSNIAKSPTLSFPKLGKYGDRRKKNRQTTAQLHRTSLWTERKRGGGGARHQISSVESFFNFMYECLHNTRVVYLACWPVSALFWPKLMESSSWFRSRYFIDLCIILGDTKWILWSPSHGHVILGSVGRLYFYSYFV